MGAGVRKRVFVLGGAGGGEGGNTQSQNLQYGKL
tara:strand:+ start:346 stop:447 length:102 start_codon:yes stop_codon:yes gene_type:complete